MPIHRAQGHSLQGAARMLSELKCQFDLSNGDIDLSRYKVVVLADEVDIEGDLKEALSRHVENGGAIISSAFAGLSPDRSGFALSSYKLGYEGPEPYTYTFFEPLPEVAEGLPEMPITIYDPGIAMTAQSGAQVLAKLHKPYFNHMEWDMYHEQFYCPPEKDSGRPALVRCGNIFHFSFPVFRNYIRHAYYPHRQLVGNCLKLALPNPMVRVDNVPSFGQVTVASKGQQKLVHLLLYVPELRGKSQVIEDPILAKDVRVSLRTDGASIAKAYLAPSKTELPVERDGEYATVTIPEMCGYQLVVFEA